MFFRFLGVSLFLCLSICSYAQLSNHTPALDFDAVEEVVLGQTPNNELIVNSRLFDFDSSLLTPWIEEITHLRTYGVDFSKSKGADGLYRYTESKRVNDFINFCKEKKLKVVWTLNLSSFTLDQEMDFVQSLIDRGLDISAFEYGGEFYLRKYVFGDMNAKGVLEKIRMDGDNRDYLDLLDMWLPPMMEKYPPGEYEHVLVAASVTGAENKTNKYRKEFNRKVFEYAKSNPSLREKVSFSYHIYAGAKPDRYSKDEELVLTPDKVDWSFLNDKPEWGRWVVTESGYYITDFSQSQLELAKQFYIDQSARLEELGGMMGIHVLINNSNRPNALALYDLGGITSVGRMVQEWLSGAENIQNSNSNNSQIGGDTASDSSQNVKYDQENQPPNTGKASDGPVLVEIYPEYHGFLQWIHFSHTLKFSNGKSYKRSYWFSSPDFSITDIGKSMSYFKKVLKSK